MNANELADLLETTKSTNNKAATMLRQQQAEIEVLKNEVAMWQMSYENCHRMCSGYGMN